MQTDTASAVVPGRYFWELVFDYDNSKNTGDIERKVITEKTRKVRSKEFLSNTFNIHAGFTFKNESRASLTVEGIGEGSTQAEYGYHLELADELVKTTETAEEIDEKTVVEQMYTVTGGSHLSLYELVYVMSGAYQKTGVVSTTTRKEVLVNLKFKIAKRILGLPEILDLFSKTVPKSENTREWKSIRDTIVQSGDQTQEEAFLAFLEVLSGIAPEHANRQEWADIRATCDEITEAWESDKQLLFKKLLLRFSVTAPAADNQREWDAIRSLSNEILGELKQLY